jgi:DNA repair photolyase
MQNKNDALKFRPVALPCGEKGSTRLYTTNLFVGGCPHLCKYCYAQGFRAFSKSGPRPVAMPAITSVRKWPRKIFLSSASDPFHPVVVKQAGQLLKFALQAGSFVVISTKALATPEIVRMLSRYSDQVSYSVSLTSLNLDRNRILEPHAPDADERLHGKKENGQNFLCGIEQLAASGLHLTLKVDTIFPGFDDADENIARLLNEAKLCGAEAVTFSYAFFRKKFQKKLSNIPFLQKSLFAMNEYQPIASGMGFSLPLSEKKVRLSYMAQMAKDIGYQVISTCSCKNRIQSVSEGIPMRLDCHFHDRFF